jgi:hypothetical protein
VRELRAAPRPRDSCHLPFRPRACSATRVLVQNGFKARNVSGGVLSHAMLAVN